MNEPAVRGMQTEEVAAEEVERAIADDQRKRNATEQQEELRRFCALFQEGDASARRRPAYDRLMSAPYAIFRVHRDTYTSRCFDGTKSAGRKPPWFITDLEFGKVCAERICSDEAFAFRGEDGAAEAGPDGDAPAPCAAETSPRLGAFPSACDESQISKPPG